MGSYAPILRRYAMGEDDRPLEYDGEVKSVSAEDIYASSATPPGGVRHNPPDRGMN